MLDTPTLAPAFRLPDLNGETVSLKSLRGKENVVLVFNRGLACAFCRQYMHSLRRDLNGFTVRHAAVLVVAPDHPDALREYWAREEIPLQVLADPDHRVAALYRQKVDFGRGRMPLVVVVSWDGRMRFRQDGSSEADLPPPALLFEVLDRINREPPA
jgi:peroxiredoxin